MALPITVPYVFGNVTTSIPLSNLDSDFATIYAAVNGIGNGTVALANVVITGGTISANISGNTTVTGNITVTNSTTTGGHYSQGALGVAFTDGIVMDYATGNGRISVGGGDGITFYTGGVANTSIGSVSSAGAWTFPSVTDSALTSGRVTYAGASGLLQDSANMTFNGTSLTLANDASISGLTVGKGGGAANTVFGVNALALIGNSGDVGIGNNAGAAKTTTSDTAQSTFVGYYAGAAVNTGTDNTFIGGVTGRNTTTGSNNVALGGYSFFTNTTGSYNTVVGKDALRLNTTASNNTAVGYIAASSTTTGYGIVAVGNAAGTANTTGQEWTAIGANALASNTTGSYNTAIGRQALNANTTASNNTAVGYQAGYANVTGTDNFFGGAFAGAANTASGNVFVGKESAKSNTSGASNIAIGFTALVNNTTGSNNTAIGSGVSGVSVGALGANTTGSANTAIGQAALYSNTTASNNTAVGYQAGYNSTAGSNTFLGYQAGSNLTTGGSNTYIGSGVQAGSTSSAYEIVIGSGATGKGSNTGFINPNSGGVYQGNNSAAWSITSDQRLKKNIVDNTVGLDAINKIQVRDFEYRTADEVTDLPKENAVDIKGVQLGAIAQELAEVLPDCVKTESTGVMSVDTTNITWHLINAVKELSAKVTALEAQLAAK